MKTFGFLQSRISVILIEVAATTSCVTGQVASDKASTDKSKAEAAPAAHADLKASPQEIIDWQQFFQPAPDVVERSRLEMRVAHWVDTGSPAELLGKARAELALGKIRSAEANLREALRLLPSDLDAWVELAGVYARTREPVKLFEVMGEIDDKLASRSEVNPAIRLRVAFLKATGLEMAGRSAESRDALSSLIQTHGDFTPAYVALANSYLNAGRDSVAEFIAKRALDRGKEDPAIENILGAVALRRNDVKGAVAHFNRALELAPTYGQALVNRATAALREANNAGAEEDLNKAIALDPNNAQAMVVRGVLMRRTGRVDLAQAAFERVLEIEPLNPEARFNLAVLTAVNGKNLDRAIRLFQEVITLPGISPELSRRAQQGLSDLKAMM